MQLAPLEEQLATPNCGRKHSAEWRANQSAGVKRAYSEGKLDHIKYPSRDLIEKRTKPLRGRKRPEEVCKAVSASVKKAWQAGKYHQLKGASRDHMDAIRLRRDATKLKARGAEILQRLNAEWKAAGTMDAMRRKAKTAKGMPDHLAAKAWIVRDPQGRPHQFRNLAEWARQNQHLFEDDRPTSKTPFWLRISGGITDLFKSNGRVCSYRGWTAVSKLELYLLGRDLLGRDSCNNQETENT